MNFKLWVIRSICRTPEQYRTTVMGFVFSVEWVSVNAKFVCLTREFWSKQVSLQWPVCYPFRIPDLPTMSSWQWVVVSLCFCDGLFPFPATYAYRSLGSVSLTTIVTWVSHPPIPRVTSFSSIFVSSTLVHRGQYYCSWPESVSQGRHVVYCASGLRIRDCRGDSWHTEEYLKD
jgi:hypothetical protein